MERAYSTICVKALDAERREFSGVATAPAHDRVNDSIDPLGCRFVNPLVLLRAHDHTAPIGTVKFGRPSKAGIGFTATIPKIDEPGLLQDRTNLSWQEVKHGLVRAVSIGFRPLTAPSPNKKGGLDYPSVEVFELSTVSVPCQQLATIDQVRSLDAAVRRGEAPAPASSLWERVARVGLHSLKAFEAAGELKQLGSYGIAVGNARSTQRMLQELCDHIEGLERRLAQ